MSLQLYQVDQKNYLLDFKSLDIAINHCDYISVGGLCGSGKDESPAVPGRSEELPAGLQEP